MYVRNATHPKKIIKLPKIQNFRKKDQLLSLYQIVIDCHPDDSGNAVPMSTYENLEY